MTVLIVVAEETVEEDVVELAVEVWDAVEVDNDVLEDVTGGLVSVVVVWGTEGVEVVK